MNRHDLIAVDNRTSRVLRIVARDLSNDDAICCRKALLKWPRRDISTVEIVPAGKYAVGDVVDCEVFA